MKEKTFLHFGYFITKPIEKFECVKIESKYILTASSCFCDLMPDFFNLMQPERIARINHELIKLSKEKFDELKTIVDEIFSQDKLLYNDFLFDYNNALTLKEKFFPDYHIFSLAIEKDFIDELNDEIGDGYNLKFDTVKTDGTFCGYDILGWDHHGFHTYICNGFEEDINRKYTLKINELGLIDNDYREVVDFAKLIDGEGEPVLWLPYAVYKH